MKRTDDFQTRREHLTHLSDEALEQRFWDLAEKLVDPMLDLAHHNTTPSIERSVLLRMGFSSLEAKAIVEGVMDRGLMGKGAGHVVYKLAKMRKAAIRETGLKLAAGEGWDEAVALFKEAR
ncbi:ornithine aminomutase subunit alpha [Anoxynatronum buryatiense]|uniref:D-ornithine 4,5-aminomutase S subunit n=1 Tax=Anoxynatronum buryatiense TaxID=489973 RepID=A0AA45WVM8_9CLOT|nr:ornithine aminomutase subunit alpha [Anoxynatronum buryatiense]SMP49206.1 D-ornithine 4,5-aminomutase S subunit [Anoxynatronum buryatiense]